MSSYISQLPLAGNVVSGVAQSVTQAVNGSTPSTISNTGVNTDIRVRLSALDTSLFTNSPLMSILKTTNGMIFPYTPSITLAQSVDYMDIPLVHSNTNYQAYTRTPSVKISISGKFTVQNQQEGQYALAAVHFLRTASKSHFGEQDTKPGLPPPVLLFSGYGNYMFGALGPTTGLRVILNSHSWTYDEAIDLVSISVNNGIVVLPSMFTIQCDLTVVQTPTRMRTIFSFDSFANGTLMQNSSNNSGWI